MKQTLCFLCFMTLLSACSNVVKSQHEKSDKTVKKKQQQTFRVMFYNVENLFDTYDDPETNDDEFLPEGTMRWRLGRYYKHLRKTAQVINAIGQWGTPAICGLCEVENDTVLVHLLNRTSLKKQNYDYCITTGSDKRGINNALIYQRDKFRYMGHASKKIPFRNKKKLSRDILHVWGEVITGEKLHVFVCHFPSRSGGRKATAPDRIDAARFLRKLCDSIYAENKNPNILIMGDFNDTPSNKSMRIITKGSKAKNNMLNLFDHANELNFKGSHKYKDEWSQLDQIIVSPRWNKYLKKESTRIFAPNFLLTRKNHRGERRPLRKYAGPTYKGGYSDHLPIVADFLLPLPPD